MRELYFERNTVNTAHVIKRNMFGIAEPVTEEMPIPDVQRYIINNQRELTCYKVAYKGTRKNAVRHLRGVCYFATDEEALAYFKTISMPGYTLQLLTGDWKLLAERPADKNTNEKETDDHGKKEQ